ncbi:O-antigen ligase family protein [Planctomycetota bacterium]
MFILPTNLETNNVGAISSLRFHWLRGWAVLLAGIAIVSSAFHFWPLQSSKTWQMLSPSNTAVLLWGVIFAIIWLINRKQITIVGQLPHLSVFAYLCTNILSISFAPNLNRACYFTLKLTLVFVGGHILFSSAMFSKNSLKSIYYLITTAVVVSVSGCLIGRYGLGSDKFGFFESAYKYGTYIGVLTPLSAGFLLGGSKGRERLLGAIIIIMSLLSAGSAGTVVAIITGLIVLVVIWPVGSAKFYIMGCLLLTVGIVILLVSVPNVSFLKNDIKLVDTDGLNLKQRYIEWQAQVNLLEERPITGTGAGCINEYRSSFYYRLPKLNTLRAFDQNGWLIIAAETGIFGLVCFCWIVWHYVKLAFSQVITIGKNTSVVASRFVRANFAGLISACVANVFSSVHYNGVLIVFVLLLVIISKTDKLFGKGVNAN